MGKIIDCKRLSPTHTWTKNGVSFKSAYAQVGIYEDDSDPLHDVTIELFCRVTAYNPNSSTLTINSGTVVANIYNSNLSGSMTVSNTSSSIASKAQRSVNASVDVATIARTESPQTFTFSLSLEIDNGTYSGSYTLTIPPYKQNATNSDRRITYTVDGTKYDLLNYL